ncbi:MAG: futalosine hydrolase [Chitinophagaceae bacterium]|nr:futalosine hydrolase [Chitinophagaceae bacterium]MBN8668556.1 futalosine hydrolase [Chitinophagales bacterium]
MQILLVASTSLEIKPFMAQIRSGDLGTLSRHELDILITGVGLMSSTYAISRQIHLKRPDLVIQAGLAGSFDTSQYPIGSLVVVGKEWVADLGVKEKGEFRDLFGLGLSRPNQFPYKKGCLINPDLKSLKEVGLPVVNGVSVNSITHSPAIAREYTTRYKPAVESMEGAALHYTCLMEGLPFIQLRAVSNKVGDRNKKNWDIPGAVDRLNKGLLYLIQSI